MDKPKILIIQAAGEHQANANFREGLSLMRAFDRLDIESMIWGKGYSNFSRPLEDIAKEYDVLFVVENYAMDWIPNMKNLRNIKMFWSIDGHMVLEQHQKWTVANGIDIVLNSCAQFTGAFPGAKQSVWFPNCVDETLVYPMPNVVKKYAIGFCGNVSNRGPLLEMLRPFGIKQDIFVIGDAMREALNSYMIGWNFNINNDINYRTFEVTAARTMLMTNRTDAISMLFDEDVEIILYDGREDMLKKVQYYIAHPQECRKIAQAGYQKTLSMHTYFHRAKVILEVLKESEKLVSVKTNEIGNPIDNKELAKKQFPERSNPTIDNFKTNTDKKYEWKSGITKAVTPKFQAGTNRDLPSRSDGTTTEPKQEVVKTDQEITKENNEPISYEDYFKTKK